jgi:hypothetical protein
MNNDQTQLNIRVTIVTKAQLNSIGINLPEDQMQALIQHAEDTINSQIGEEIVESLDDDQLKELVQMQDNDAPAEEIDAWIRARVPEYDEIIEDNVAIVLGELADNSDAIQA